MEEREREREKSTSELECKTIHCIYLRFRFAINIKKG